MNYMLLGLAALSVTCQDIFKQKFNHKRKTGVYLFSGMVALFAMLFFVFINDDWSYSYTQLFPSFSFAISYASCTLFSVLAIRHGSLAKTTLINSCSLLIPSFYGIIFLSEPVSSTLVAGTVLLVVALWMINYQKDPTPSTWKWVIFVFLAFVGNGMCSTVQKIAQNTFGDAGKNVFMIVALGMVATIMFTMSLFSKDERHAHREIIKDGWLWSMLCGSFNGLCNFLVLFLNPRVPASVMFPVISAGSVVLVFVYAVLVTKEKFNLRQKIGYALGVISIILLNL